MHTTTVAFYFLHSARQPKYTVGLTAVVGDDPCASHIRATETATLAVLAADRPKFGEPLLNQVCGGEERYANNEEARFYRINIQIRSHRLAMNICKQKRTLPR